MERVLNDRSSSLGLANEARPVLRSLYFPTHSATVSRESRWSMTLIIENNDNGYCASERKKENASLSHLSSLSDLSSNYSTKKPSFFVKLVEFGGRKNISRLSSWKYRDLVVQSRNLRTNEFCRFPIISQKFHRSADEELVIKIFSPLSLSFPNFCIRQLYLVSPIVNNTREISILVPTFAKIRGRFVFLYKKKKKNYLHRFFATNLTRIFIFV